MKKTISHQSLDSTPYQNALAGLQNFHLTNQYPIQKFCFFDIETTGLAADISSLYLIGCGYIAENQLNIMQWFADDYISEKDLLLSFAKFIKNFSALVHYNGTGFDIPYMEKKYAFHKMESPFSLLESIDFYKLLRPYKNWFSLENLKLATIENFLCIKRNDRFSGKDCITLYANYMQMKYFAEKERKEACYYSLLLHNHDDILGTFLCSQLLLYLFPFTNNLNAVTQNVDEKDILDVIVTLPGQVPTPLVQKGKNLDFSYQRDYFRVKIPVFIGECYYFFKDYKNYYYFPEEDQAIHKSVATFATGEKCVKASSKNCYTKKNSYFLPLFKFKRSDTSFEGVPMFFNKTKELAFVEWENPINFQEVMGSYLKNFLK